VLAPAVLGSMFLLFGSGSRPTRRLKHDGDDCDHPIQIGSILSATFLFRQTHIGYALGFAMIVIRLISVVLNPSCVEDVAMASLELGQVSSATISWTSSGPR